MTFSFYNVGEGGGNQCKTKIQDFPAKCNLRKEIIITETPLLRFLSCLIQYEYFFERKILFPQVVHRPVFFHTVKCRFDASPTSPCCNHCQESSTLANHRRQRPEGSLLGAGDSLCCWTNYCFTAVINHTDDVQTNTLTMRMTASSSQISPFSWFWFV